MSSSNHSATAAAPAPVAPVAPARPAAGRPTRVVLVLYRDDLNVGGSLRVAEILAQALNRSRVEAHLVFTYGGPGPITNRATVPCHFLQADGPLDPKAWFRARSMMAEINPDIIHFHNPAYWLHAALTGRNYKKLVHLHGPFFPSQMSAFDRWLKRQTGRIADAMVCITRDMRQMVVREKWGAPEQVWTVYNSIDCLAPHTAPSKQDARRLLGLPAKAKILGVVCRLAWYKGCADGIRVLERLPEDWHLLFCGDGPMKAYLKDLAAQAGLADRTHFAGMVDDMRVAYAAMDAFLFTSKLEPFGLVIAEAMAARIPVFGFAAEGAYRDEFYPLITPRNSVFVERASPGDYISPEPAGVVEDLARHIVRYGERPDEFRPMIEHAEQWVSERFDSKVQAEAMLEIYDYVLGRQTDAPK